MVYSLPPYDEDREKEFLTEWQNKKKIFALEVDENHLEKAFKWFRIIQSMLKLRPKDTLDILKETTIIKKNTSIEIKSKQECLFYVAVKQ